MSGEGQPYLHDLVVSLAAPTVVLSGRDGQIRPTGAQGVLHADVRVLSRAEVTVGGEEPVPVARGSASAGSARFVSLVRSLGDRGPDPTVRLERTRETAAGQVVERLTVRSAAAEPVATELVLTVAADLAPIEVIKAGDAWPSADAVLDGDTVSWCGEGTAVTLQATGARGEVDDGGQVVLRWRVALAPQSEVTLEWSLRVEDSGAVVTAAPAAPSWRPVTVRAEDRRLPALVTRSLSDLEALRMVATHRPDDVFLAAGAPWYLTLFGRDSLWAARMLLPVTTTIASTTLRLLADYQGARVDPATGEQPGKIPHELRRVPAEHGAAEPGRRLPPLYFGTVDATALWVLLLHDAWRWGLPAAQVEALLPALEAALGWLRDYADPDGDGFLEYVDTSGRGLANQGWKDSGDAVRFADGRQAEPPIALCEVQGYAHEAALGAAELLDAFGRPGGAQWRGWADDLAQRFRAAFWLESPQGRYPALALDRAKDRVDSVTSNIGHLLGTGLLDAQETEAVAARVTGEDLDGGLGLRTMSAHDGGFSPLSYHCGSVWPHDTAIVLHGLVRAGQGTRTAGPVLGLLAAAEGFGYRLPELWSGDDRSSPASPVPYPAACRPQAWSAASALVLLQAVLGLEVDVPRGVVTVRPPRPSLVGAVRVEGLRVGDDALVVELDAAGRVVEVSGTSLRVESG